MNSRIYKYPLNAITEQNITMPAKSEILTVQVQGDTLCLWALVNPDAELKERTIEIYGTGHLLIDADSLQYISTFMLESDTLVFHVFERLGLV